MKYITNVVIPLNRVGVSIENYGQDILQLGIESRNPLKSGRCFNEIFEIIKDGLLDGVVIPLNRVGVSIITIQLEYMCLESYVVIPLNRVKVSTKL